MWRQKRRQAVPQRRMDAGAQEGEKDADMEEGENEDAEASEDEELRTRPNKRRAVENQKAMGLDSATG